MSLPQVGQVQLLAELLGQAIKRYGPSSIALLGCAGGNGLDKVVSTSVERVVGIDINQEYLDRAEIRYKSQIASLELVVGDLAVDQFTFAPVGLVFAGLIFEYVEASKLLKQVVSMLREGGRLVSVIQLTSKIEDVTPSPYASLKSVSSVLNVVAPDQLLQLAKRAGFKVESSCEVRTSGGKVFQVNSYRVTSSTS